jgi:hypothetical protein
MSIIGKWTFEDGADPPYPQSGVIISSGNAPGRSSDHARVGTKSLKCFVDRINSANMYRTEVANNSPRMTANQGTATPYYWVAFSLYVPNPYPVMTFPTYELFHQIYMSPPEGLTWDTYANNSPPIAFYLRPITNTTGNFRLIVRASSDPYPQPFPLPTIYSPIFGAYTAGQWHDFVIRYRLDSGNAGLIQVWLNGQQFVNRTGINYCPGHGGGTRKFGLYTGWRTRSISGEAVSTRTLYFDEYCFATDPSTFEQVTPGGGSSPVEPEPTPTVREPFATKPSIPANPVVAVNFDARRQGAAEVSGQGITYQSAREPNTADTYRPVTNIDFFPRIFPITGEAVAHKIGSNTAGDWRAHTVDIPSPVNVTPRLRVASRFGVADPTQPFLRVRLGGNAIATFMAPAASGSWDIWETVEAAPVALPAGSNQEIRFEVLQGGADYSFMEFVLLDVGEPTPPDPDPDPDDESVDPSVVIGGNIRGRGKKALHSGDVYGR